MEENIQNELKELQNLPEAELDETQRNRLGELNQWAEAEKTATEKSTDLQSALAQKEHFRTKAEEAETRLKGLEGVKPSVPDEIWKASNDPLEVVRLGKTLKDYSEEETEFIIRNAQTKDIEGIIKAEKDTFVQSAIQSMREKVAKEGKIPSPSSGGSSGKEYTYEEIGKMTPAEHKKFEQDFLTKQKGVMGV